ncbi:MAG TPA: C39 family peptidase, partial [Dehalococcoidia bacterium]|nr:C39 family peptidase [Dehalococcoidia bacterium]
MRPDSRRLPSLRLRLAPPVGRRLAALLIGLVSLAATVAPVGAQSPSDLFYLPIRYRSQFDGSDYQSGNCGPASLAMVVSAMRDEHIETTEIREAANFLQGTFRMYDSGTSLDVLAAIGRRYGAIPMGLYDGDIYRHWTLDEVRDHLHAGHPVIPQVDFVKLPGHEYGDPTIDHYIVLIGTSGEDFVYHDPAFNDGAGQSLFISADRLKKAWQAGDFGFAAVAFRPESSLPSLLPTPVPTQEPIPPTATPVPPTPTSAPPAPSPTVALPAAPASPTLTPPSPTGPGLIERLLTADGFGFGLAPAPSPTPDTSAWQIGAVRADR